MTYIKNTITRLGDWLNDLPQNSTSCEVSNRVELLNKTIARHAEKNINRTSIHGRPYRRRHGPVVRIPVRHRRDSHRDHEHHR